MNISNKIVYTAQHKLDWSKIEDEVAVRIRKAAQYYCSEDIVELIQRSDAMKSIRALVEANVLRLPFPAVLFEFAATDKFRWFVLLEEQDAEGTRAWFKAQAIFTHLPTNRTFYSSRDAQCRLDDTSFKVTNVNTKQDAHAIICAVTMGLLFLNTRGIEKTRVEYTQLNKARVKSGKTPVPTVSIMHIATVFDRDGRGQKYLGGGGLKRVHFRSGYSRSQHHGPKNSLTKIVYIEPCLVNYKPGDETPELPKKRMEA